MDDECIIVGDDDAAFQFIWKNGSEWDPLVAISDYSSGDLANRLYQDTENNLHTGSLNGLQIIGSNL
jgi:hypothetical protein